MKGIFGRSEEIKTLQRILSSNKPEFLAIYGRRRIGKTYLIREFFSGKNATFFNITGEKEGARRQQIKHFTEALGKVFYGGMMPETPKDWDEAFSLLTKTIENQAKAKKIVLFFDEIPWMATKKSGFLRGLDYYWNQYWSSDRRIKLIICGSSAAWIINKVINDRGGLHNRITHRMHLEPFTLIETKRYLAGNGVKLNNEHILSLYMVTGGIPFYLESIEQGGSSSQIIENLAFHKKGILVHEFSNLFASLFDDAQSYIEMIRALAKHPHGLGKTALLNRLGSSENGGGGLKKLQELEETGFILSFMPYQHKRQGIYYRLVDEYSLFYLKWIEPIKAKLLKGTFKRSDWQALQKSPAWHSWLGIAFESICYKHLGLISEALKIPSGGLADSWRYAPHQKSQERGAQIDLLFDRMDDAITICEIKYTDNPFVLTKEYVAALQRKLDVFKAQTKTKKQLFLSLISANGLKNNYYADEMITGIVTLDDLFKD